MKNITLPALLFFVNVAFAQLTLTPFNPESSYYLFATASDVHQNEAILTSRITPLSFENKVCIFEKTTGGMDEVAAFTPGDGAATDNYGISICIFGDYAAVGSPYHSVGVTASGAVYLYHKNDGVWEFQEKITAPEPFAGEHFGTKVEMNGSQLFVGAPADNLPAATAAGTIYVFDIEPTVTFSQMLTDGDAEGIGFDFDVEDNMLVYSYYHPSIGDYHVATFDYNTTQNIWEATDNFFYSAQNFNIAQLRLDSNNLYVAKPFTSFEPQGLGQILPYHRQGNAWIADTAIPATLDDNQFTSFDVAGNHMLIGLGWYVLLMPRKSPLLYYKKVSGSWTYQETLYGNGNEGLDDGLGKNIAMSPELFVVGAPTQSQPQYGQAYAVDGALGLENWQRNSAVWPNPTSGKLFIDNTNTIISKAEIYSISGTLLFSKNAPAESIDMSQFSQGVYFLKLFTGDTAREVHKIIKN